MNEKRANTAVPIHQPIAERWSPRAFGPEEISKEDELGLLEAARWAPSCFGAEPWRFVVGVRGRGDGHATIAETLVPGNRVWAEKAPMLMITVAQDAFEHNGKPNAWAQHDVGLAMGQLGIEASARGLVLHQMGGFDANKARELLKIPAGYTPIAAVAIGHPGDATSLPEELSKRELETRARKPLSAIVFDGEFGRSAE